MQHAAHLVRAAVYEYGAAIVVQVGRLIFPRVFKHLSKAVAFEQDILPAARRLLHTEK
jgi:hypothetical protein